MVERATQTSLFVTFVLVAINHQAFFRGPPTALSDFKFFFFFSSFSLFIIAVRFAFVLIRHWPLVFSSDDSLLHGCFVDVSILEAAFFRHCRRLSLNFSERGSRERSLNGELFLELIVAWRFEVASNAPSAFILPSGCAASVGVENGDEKRCTTDACRCVLTMYSSTYFSDIVSGERSTYAHR